MFPSAPPTQRCPRRVCCSYSGGDTYRVTMQPDFRGGASKRWGTFFARESPELTWEGGWALAPLFIVDARRTFFSLPVIPRFLLAPARILITILHIEYYHFYCMEPKFHREEFFLVSLRGSFFRLPIRQRELDTPIRQTQISMNSAGYHHRGRK